MNERTACHRVSRLAHIKNDERGVYTPTGVRSTGQHNHFSRNVQLICCFIASPFPTLPSLTPNFLLVVVEHAGQEARGQEQGCVNCGVQFLSIFQDDTDAHILFVRVKKVVCRWT